MLKIEVNDFVVVLHGEDNPPRYGFVDKINARSGRIWVRTSEKIRGKKPTVVYAEPEEIKRIMPLEDSCNGDPTEFARAHQSEMLMYDFIQTLERMQAINENSRAALPEPVSASPIPSGTLVIVLSEPCWGIVLPEKQSGIFYKVRIDKIRWWRKTPSISVPDDQLIPIRFVGESFEDPRQAVAALWTDLYLDLAMLQLSQKCASDSHELNSAHRGLRTFLGKLGAAIRNGPSLIFSRRGKNPSKENKPNEPDQK